MDINRSVQRALLGQVPPTLRFIYASINDNSLFFRAVFTDKAPQEHIDAISEALSEVISDCDSSIKVIESFERNSNTPWKENHGSNLLYLRYGEFSAT